MKTLSLVLICLGLSSVAHAEGTMIGGGDRFDCNRAVATNRATNIVDLIAKVNGTTGHAFMRETKEDVGYFYIQRCYDTGLSVPCHTVRIEKGKCQILDIAYTNLEG